MGGTYLVLFRGFTNFVLDSVFIFCLVNLDFSSTYPVTQSIQLPVNYFGPFCNSS